MTENFNNNRLFLIFSVIFLSLMIGNHVLNRSFVKEILINEQLNILKNSSYRIEKWIEDKKLNLKSIEVLISKLDPKQDESGIKNILIQSGYIAGFSSVYIGYTTGEIISSRYFKAPIDYDLKLRPWYVNTLATNDIYITNPYKDIGLKTSVISICQSVQEKQIVKGVLCGILSFSDIKNEILNLSLGDDGFLFLIDNNLNILLHPNDKLELSKTNLDAKYINANKIMHYETQEEIITINPLQNSKLILIAKTLKKDIYKKINLQFLRNFIIYGISALLFVFLGYFFIFDLFFKSDLLNIF